MINKLKSLCSCEESEELSDAAKANIEKLTEEIKELSEVIEEKKGAHSRLKLEIDNFRQRTRSELAAARGKAAIPLVQELLPIADEYEYAKQNLKIESDGQKTVVAKFETLFDKMLQSWKSLGIEKMASVGEEFNPELHEAVSMIPSEEYKEARPSNMDDKNPLVAHRFKNFEGKKTHGNFETLLHFTAIVLEAEC